VSRGEIVADAEGRVSYEDPDVSPGKRYGYRLGLDEESGEAYFGETWVAVPRPEMLTLERPVPNPAARNATLRFTLRGGAPARVVLVDVSGRVVLAKDVRGLGPGSHSIDLLAGRRLPAGVYQVRLTEGAHSRTERLVLIH
jgi:hypothetical protein